MVFKNHPSKKNYLKNSSIHILLLSPLHNSSLFLSFFWDFCWALHFFIISFIFRQLISVNTTCQFFPICIEGGVHSGTDEALRWNWSKTNHLFSQKEHSWSQSYKKISLKKTNSVLNCFILHFSNLDHHITMVS